MPGPRNREGRAWTREGERRGVWRSVWRERRGMPVLAACLSALHAVTVSFFPGHRDIPILFRFLSLFSACLPSSSSSSSSGFSLPASSYFSPLSLSISATAPFALSNPPLQENETTSQLLSFFPSQFPFLLFYPGTGDHFVISCICLHLYAVPHNKRQLVYSVLCWIPAIPASCKCKGAIAIRQRYYSISAALDLC